MDYDQNPIQVHTVYTFEEAKCLYRLRLTAMRKLFLILFILLLFLTIISVALGVFAGNFAAVRNRLPANIFLLIFSFIPYARGSGWLFTRKRYYHFVGLVQNGIDFSFCNKDFTTLIQQDGYIRQSRVAYTRLTHVVESPGMFFLYLDAQNIYTVSKAGFITGSPDHLRALLQAYLPPRQFKMLKSNP